MQSIYLHPERFNPRDLQAAIDALQKGQLIVYPTDSSYGVGCLCHRSGALDKLYKLRGLSWQHPFSLLCPDIASMSQLSVISNSNFRFIKKHAPGPFTFVLPAVKRIERQLNLPRKRKTIGFRMPDHPLLQALLEKLGEPLANMSLHHPEDESILINPFEIEEHYGSSIAVMLDCGEGCALGTTVVDLTSDQPEVIRQGRGEL